MNLRRTQQRLMAGGVVDPYAALRAAWDAAGPTLLYSAPRETAYSDGDPVPSATEFASGTYPATQGTTLARPTYVSNGIGGRPAFSFDGGDALATASFSGIVQPDYVVVVFQVDNNTLNPTLFTRSGSGGFQFFVVGPSSPYPWRISAGTSLEGGVSDTSAHIAEISFNGASSYLKINGSTVMSGNSGANALDGLTIGSNSSQSGQYIIGEISEMVLFNTPPTSGQLSSIRAAASSYYSIPIS